MINVSNKASICAIVHLEIIDFSKKPDAEQVVIKNQLNHLINHAVIDIAHNNRAILNVADGTLIACIGPLEAALEDALLISQIIRDEILETNSLNTTPLYVRFGINLGAMQTSSDVNGKPSIVGESIIEAKRMMSFAKPNQILVSRPYYEMASELSQEISQLFEYHDMHANEQDIYSVRPLKEHAAIVEPAAISTNNAPPQNEQSIISNINWSYVPLGLLLLFALVVLIKQVSAPIEPTIVFVQPALKEPPASSASNLPAKSDDNFLLPNESLEKIPPQVSSDKIKPVENKPIENQAEEKNLVEKKPIQNKPIQNKLVHNKTDNKKVKKKIVQTQAKSKPVSETKAEAATNTAAKPVASKVDKAADTGKTGWETFKDSVKQGANRPCSQAEIAMNQCR